ncbi:hypothetical protein JVT61DRAFT_1126 [Boletus reticuloceps]|uniref:F-box domain-containing protein n=1 Tax=Boletus reticuloceps TaxID=495285 RepID=A0A8I3AC96_9AGAM|nr:hypothetical protein JVT61DRAFT_1126 [Boletus reticuloceps]
MALNTDVLMLIIEHLDIDDLLRLASTCRLFHLLVHNFGWSIFLRNNQRHSLTLQLSRSRWSPLAQVRYNHLADRAWSRANFIARPLSDPWRGCLQPAIALSIPTLLVAAGRVLYSCAVRDTSDVSPSRIVSDHSYSFNPGHGTIQPDITSIAFSLDTSQDRTVFLGFGDGSVEKVCLPPYHESHNRQHMDIERTPQTVLQYHGPNVVQSISCSSRILLSLSQWGLVFLTNLVSDSLSSTSVNLGTRSWTSHLCMSSSSPYASQKNRPSAVYGIACAPPSSPLGPSEQIIVSGWYDGSIRIYDLRVSHHSQHLPTLGSASSSSPPALLPVLTLRDPWSPEPIYAVSCGGGNASFVAAGTARHSVVAFWDVRQPSQGWSVHAPGNDSSPVYSVVLESSRLFGATQSRPFVYDFGPGVTRDTYPPITPTGSNVAGRRRITEDRLRLERNGIGYHVAKYSHRGTGIF